MPPGPLGPPPPPRERDRWWPWALLGALFVAAAIVGVILLTGGKTVRVPELVGAPGSSAASRLHREGLEVNVQPATSRTEQGLVIGQDPQPGAKLHEGDTVNLTVSSGPGAAQVSLVDGLGRNAARKELKKAGFKVLADKLEYSDTVTKNHVIQTNPPGGSQLDIGSNVRLVVSNGPTPVDVPDVGGQNVDDAKATLGDAGFTVTVKQVANKDVDPGTVLSQAPLANAQAPKGSTITLTVAKPAETVTVPDVTGESSADAAAELTAAGLKIKTQYQQLQTADGDDTVIAQDPVGGAGATAKRGSKVTITVGRFSAPSTPTAP